MLTVVLVIAALAGIWGVVSVALALLAGGIIHARDHADDARDGAAAPPAGAIVPLGLSLR